MPPDRVPVQQTGSVPDKEERQDQQLMRYISSFQGLTDQNRMYSQYDTLQISSTFLAVSQPFAQYRPYWGDESEPQTLPSFQEAYALQINGLSCIGSFPESPQVFSTTPINETWLPLMQNEDIGIGGTIFSQVPQERRHGQEKSRNSLSTQKTSISQGRKKGSTKRKPEAPPQELEIPCIFQRYGCNSVFNRKNNWKRHVRIQHLRLEFYDCDQCDDTMDGVSKQFSRKDLFVAHQKRMHRDSHRVSREGYSENSEKVSDRCRVRVRSPPPYSLCEFCKEMFIGEGSWDMRMEHVGRHFQRGDKLEKGREDVVVRDWALEEGILEMVQGKCRLVQEDF